MISDRKNSRIAPLLAIAVALGWATIGAAQVPSGPKDSTLDDLLKKVDESAKPKADPAVAKPAKPGDVAPADKDLDGLLEKLGQTKDAPSADGKKPEPPPSGEGDAPPDPGAGDKPDAKSKPKPRPDDLKGKDKDLEEHLQELAGKKKKPKGGQGGQGQGQGKDQSGEDGPLGDLIKQMREVEGRLGKPDTGEQTRQKQAEIVKRMDALIDQMRQSRSQSQAMRMMRQGKQPGKPGGEPGQMANGPPPTRPEGPKGKSIVALDKNAWGHLPPDLRSEMDNVFNEQLLPSKEDLIKRYYLSVSKKSLTRGE